MQKCTVHDDGTKPDIKHIFTRLTEQTSFILSSCIIIVNIKCTFWQVSILESRFSGKCPFGQMYILESVSSGKCAMYIPASVRSGKYTFGIMSIRPSVFWGNVLSGRCFKGRCTGSIFKTFFVLKLSISKCLTVCLSDCFIDQTVQWSSG